MYKTIFLTVASLLAAILLIVGLPFMSKVRASSVEAFSFASMGDGQAKSANFTTTVNQIASLHPDLVIFNGDLENNGVTSTEMAPMIAAIKNAGLFDQTFLVRGNHDNVISGSAALWENYFETPPNVKVLPAGVTEYVSLNSSSDYLIYSFIYGNAMFIGLDVPGNIVTYLTSAQLTFLDTRLTYAESIGLVHAFIFFHGPLYCVDSLECTCSSRTNINCTPSALVTVLNKHSIVSATFHGHEHVLSWTHMDKTRLPKLTRSFEQFITSPSGGVTYNDYIYPARMDYTYMGTLQGFSTIDVNGCSFTFNIFEDGTTAPVWSRTFTKSTCPSPTATFTFTPSSTLAETYTPTLTETFTPTSLATSTPPSNSSPVTYYLPLVINGE